MNGKTILAGVLAFAMLAAISPAWGVTKECKRDIRKAERRLKKAEKDHGQNSKQAELRRKELDNVRARCGESTQNNQKGDPH